MVNEPARVTQHLRPRAWIQAGRPSLLYKETECQVAKGGGRARVAPSGARTPSWGQQGRGVAEGLVQRAGRLAPALPFLPTRWRTPTGPEARNPSLRSKPPMLAS